MHPCGWLFEMFGMYRLFNRVLGKSEQKTVGKYMYFIGRQYLTVKRVDSCFKPPTDTAQ